MKEVVKQRPACRRCGATLKYQFSRCPRCGRRSLLGMFIPRRFRA